MPLKIRWEAGVLDNHGKRFPRIHVAIKIPNYGKRNASPKLFRNQCLILQPLLWNQCSWMLIRHKKRVDKVVGDSWGTCPHRKWAQTRRAWLNSWDFRRTLGFAKATHAISRFNAFARKCSPKQQRQDGTSVKFMVVFDAWRISLQPSCPHPLLFLAGFCALPWLLTWPLPSQHKLQHTEEYWQVYDA